MKKQLLIRGILMARTGMHIGTGEADSVTDAPFRRTASGELVIPGTSLAGLLRSTATMLAPVIGHDPCEALITGDAARICSCIVCRMMGNIGSPGEMDSASRLWVYDAHPFTDSGTFVRDRIGINRETGTAASEEAAKFDLEVVPSGFSYNMRLALEQADNGDDICLQEQLLAACLAEWMEGRLYVGGGAGRGLGAFELESAEVRSLDFSNSSDILAYLSCDDPWEVAGPSENWLEERLKTVREKLCRVSRKNDQIDSRVPFVIIEADLQARDLFLVNDLLSGGRSGFDMASFNENGCHVLVGSTIRGVLRNRAERIARTLWTCEQDTASPDMDKCPACHTLGDNPGAPLAPCSTVIREKSKKIWRKKPPEEQYFCLACRLFGSSYYGSRLRIEDSPLIGKPRYKALDYLAIDRFTGGGIEGAKFDAVALYRPEFHLRLMLTNPDEWEMGWLALLLKDLVEGQLAFGWGQAKGFGDVTAKDPVIVFGVANESDLYSLAPAEEVTKAFTVKQSGIFKLCRLKPGNKPTGWPQWMQRWVDSFACSVRDYKSSEVLAGRESDVYFGTVSAKLYPVVK